MSEFTPTAAILIIGNEILSGRTQDAHVQYIACRLAQKGIVLQEVRMMKDNESSIIAAVRDMSLHYEFVFTTGGIGPTHDDITADCIAKAFRAPLEIHPEAKERLRVYYDAKKQELNESRLRMARIPQGATLIDNPVSAAPGFKIENVYVMAGVPEIMRAMFVNIEKELPQGLPTLSETFTCALHEGDIAVDLETIQKNFPELDIGSYPAKNEDGTRQLSLVVRGTSKSRILDASEMVQELIAKHSAKK